MGLVVPRVVSRDRLGQEWGQSWEGEAGSVTVGEEHGAREEGGEPALRSLREPPPQGPGTKKPAISHARCGRRVGPALHLSPSSEGSDGLSGLRRHGDLGPKKDLCLQRTCRARVLWKRWEDLGWDGPRSTAMGVAPHSPASSAQRARPTRSPTGRPWPWAVPALNLGETDMTRGERWDDHGCLGEADKVACRPEGWITLCCSPLDLSREALKGWAPRCRGPQCPDL